MVSNIFTIFTIIETRSSETTVSEYGSKKANHEILQQRKGDCCFAIDTRAIINKCVDDRSNWSSSHWQDTAAHESYRRATNINLELLNAKATYLRSAIDELNDYEFNVIGLSIDDM